MTKPVLILEARFYNDLADMALEGAREAIESNNLTHEVYTVPGCLEIPAALSFAAKSGRYSAYVVLGAVIRGETTHYDVVCNECMRGIYDLVIKHDLALGNGIQTVENKAQAIARFDKKQKNKAGAAVEAALRMVTLKHDFLGDVK